VTPGDHLVSIYSPDLLTAQRELLLNLQLERQRPAGSREPAPTEPTRQRLLLWGITQAQIDELARTGEPLTHLTVFAPMGGTVIEKNVRAGQYVKTGDALYTIADLSRVWVVVDVYERELAWVRFGQPVDLTLESQPGRVFVGTVGFIEPVLNEETRTIRVRVMLQNPLRNEEALFKPGMFVEATLRVPLRPDGAPGPTGLEGKYVCPMHPFVVQDEPVPCRVCGMALDQVPGEPTEPGPVLAVPASAVLSTGRRHIVYVEDSPGEYRQVEPVLGPRAGEFFPVLAGLTAGERVATRGSFLIDSQFQISGKPSLLYPDGIGHEGHQAPARATESPPPPAPEGHHHGHGR
jgi:membrane fusion protein, copper/silver efflux system